MKKSATMPSSTTEHLVRLIESMTKAEKRAFKLYACRQGGKDEALFVKLFDAIDTQRQYDEKAILQKVPGIKPTQLSNLKRHLYRQLLTSLRLIHAPRNPDIEIREQLDFARVLYNKGHYAQAIKILERLESLARERNLLLLHLEVVEMEKMINSRHVSPRIIEQASDLMARSGRLSRSVEQSVRYSNLALQLYGLLLKTGPVRNEKEADYVTRLFHSQLPSESFEKLTFFEKVQYCQCYALYHYILQQFPLHYRYSRMWVDLFDEQPAMQGYDPELYLRGLHNLLNALFYAADTQRHSEVLRRLERFLLQQAENFDTNLEVQAFVFLYTAKLNKHFMEGTFSEGLYLIPELEGKLTQYANQLDNHRLLTFWYKMGCLYFGAADFGRSIDYLNNIINYKAGNLFGDLQCYARILHLIAHYELGHFNLLEYLVKSVYRFLGKMEDLNAVQRQILHFLKTEIRTPPNQLQKAFEQLRSKLVMLRKHPYEARAFLYLDILSWLDSKIRGVPVQQVIRERFVARR